MKFTRPLIGLVSVAAVGAFALPSQAAAKTATLYFDNQGKSGTGPCTPAYVLTKSTPAGTPCEGETVAVDDNGAVTTDTYGSLSNAVGWKLDTKRPLTGVVNIGNYPVVSSGASPNQTFGGPSGADITIQVNGITVGTVSGSGVAAPGGAVAIPVKLKLPAKLNKKVVKSVTTIVKMTTGVVLTGVSYGDNTQSKLVFPTR